MVLRKHDGMKQRPDNDLGQEFTVFSSHETPLLSGNFGPGSRPSARRAGLTGRKLASSISMRGSTDTSSACMRSNHAADLLPRWHGGRFQIIFAKQVICNLQYGMIAVILG